MDLQILCERKKNKPRNIQEIKFYNDELGSLT